MSVFYAKSDANDSKALVIGRIGLAGAASRAELTETLQLSRATVSRAIDELIQTGILEEGETIAGQRGRNPVLLHLNAGQVFAIGICLATRKIALVDARGRVCCEKTIALDPADFQGSMCRIVAAVSELAEEYPLGGGKCCGIGVTATGMTDVARGALKSTGCFAMPGPFPVGRILAEATGLPVRLDNQTTVSTLLEKLEGSAAHAENFLYYTLGGMGMFLNGRIYLGSQDRAGEIGFLKYKRTDAPHTELWSDSWRKSDPLSTMHLSLKKEMEAKSYTVARQRAAEHPEWDYRELLVAGALERDTVCTHILRRAFDEIGDFLVGLALTFNPELILLPEWTASIPECTVDRVRSQLELCRAVDDDFQIEVRSSSVAAERFAAGMAIITLKRFFGMEK